MKGYLSAMAMVVKLKFCDVESQLSWSYFLEDKNTKPEVTILYDHTFRLVSTQYNI